MPPPSPFYAGLRARCPRCGQGALFKGILDIGDECENCQLDYGFADAGDGPAVFVVLILGFVLCGAALWTELVFEPPLWLHAVVWLPITLALSVLMLRVIKATLVALQYKHDAGESRPG